MINKNKQTLNMDKWLTLPLNQWDDNYASKPTEFSFYPPVQWLGERLSA